MRDLTCALRLDGPSRGIGGMKWKTGLFCSGDSIYVETGRNLQLLFDC